MPRSNNLLHKKHLAEFKQFCAAQGWKEEPCKGDYEVYRAFTDSDFLIVHTGVSAPEHYVVWGESYEMAHTFYQSRKSKKCCVLSPA